MTFPISFRRTPALKTRALVSALSLCFIPVASYAQVATQSLPPVSVTGARFASDPALLPIGATAITADEIRRAGVSDVNQAIRKIGGVYGSQSTNASPDFSLDLRGFGANTTQNLVVIVDGVRISENDLNNAMLSAIPIDSVERIEITRGGSSVLYGEGATGGTINVVTKRPNRQGGRGSLFTEAGHFGLREVRAEAAQAWNGFALDAAAGSLHTDNYRNNNTFKKTYFSGGAQWLEKHGRIGLRFDSSNQDSGAPGGLTLAQFNANPRQALTSGSFGSLDSDRLTAFIEHRFGALDLAAELSHREKTVTSTTAAPSFSEYDSRQTLFSPRLRHLGHFNGLINELVAGVDLADWGRISRTRTSQVDAKQKSKAIYVRDEVKFDGARNARIALGVRREIFDKDSFNLRTARINYDIKQILNAWDGQASYNPLPLLNLYTKVGQSYRVANVDENGSTPVTNKPLAAQISHDLELGTTLGDAARSVTMRLFRHKLNDEIYFDPTIGTGKNTNLDPTKRQGFEIDTSTNLGADWRLSGHLQHVKATFTEGPNAGKKMVLVPKNVFSARLSWIPSNGQSADIGAQWVDSQRYGGDFTNTCATQIPSYTTLDARYAKRLGAWEVAISGLNLTDRQYYNSAYRCQDRIYPSDGRQIKISARYDF